MLPPVIYMHRVNSSHCESHSGGLVKLSNSFLGDFFSRNHGSISPFFPLGVPSRGPTGPRGSGTGDLALARLICSTAHGPPEGGSS